MSADPIRGVLPMLVTPFNAAGAVALDELATVAEAALSDGADGLSVNGLGGEVGALSEEERTLTAKAAIEAAAGAPVVVGTSALTTESAVRIALRAAELGATALMIAPPPEPAWPRERMLAHYGEVAASVAPVPVMVQDAPDFVGASLDRDFVAELRRGHANVRYAKPESVPAADAVAHLVAGEGPAVGVLAGHGGLYLLDVLGAGAQGVIPGPEHVAAFARVVDAWRRDDEVAAREEFGSLLPLLVTEFQSLPIFVASVKAVLRQRGLISCDELRGVSSPLGTASRELLLACAERAGALSASAHGGSG